MRRGQSHPHFKGVGEAAGVHEVVFNVVRRLNNLGSLQSVRWAGDMLSRPGLSRLQGAVPHERYEATSDVWI